MSFDGCPRPGQLNPYSDPLNPYAALNAARAEQAGKPLVKSLGKEEKVTAAQRDDRDAPEPGGDEENGEAFSQEEAEQILLFARMRGLMDFSLESGVRYEFRVNEAVGCIDLLETESGKTVLQLSPDELARLSEKIHRYGGMLADRSG